VSESKPSSDAAPTYGYGNNLKLRRAPERILSPQEYGYQRLKRLSAWTVRWVLNIRSNARAKRLRVEATVLARATTTQGSSFVVYRRQMLELLRWPKPVFDQLAIELPALMGFRPEEVGTWRAEYIDFQNGDTLVLDARKHRLFTVPLNNQAARHAEEVLDGRSEGYVLKNRSNAWRKRDQPIRPTAVWYIWRAWTLAAALRNAEEISPVVGRRFFAAEWYYSQRLSLVTLQRILRHTHFETTMRYVHGLVFHEDVKRDYDRFQLGLMQEVPLTHAVNQS